MPTCIGPPRLVAADEDASKALKSLSKGDLVAVRCPAEPDGGETFWLASMRAANLRVKLSSTGPLRTPAPRGHPLQTH
jgi:hypothetical protein